MQYQFNPSTNRIAPITPYRQVQRPHLFSYGGFILPIPLQRSNQSGGSLSVSSAGSTGAILWAVGADGVIHALDANDISKPELWSSATKSKDSLGSVGHFQFPTIINGKLYVGSGQGQIVVYGLSVRIAMCVNADSHSLQN